MRTHRIGKLVVAKNPGIFRKKAKQQARQENIQRVALKRPIVLLDKVIQQGKRMNKPVKSIAND
ncbi:hypothetical protein [Thiothrix lacustris]|uniref:hypothetical protein n=1 Tax=Thiothrix lacustris TaxID=525917 RepID=UPI0027E58125|nr:hypothetical protein [Thiothrix lacustris]WMP19381.1 hypothetical protein RCS87_00365 [Thiothrix lacustris]